MWPLTKGLRDFCSGWEGQLALPAIGTAMGTKGKQYSLLAVITESTADVHQGPLVTSALPWVFQRPVLLNDNVYRTHVSCWPAKRCPNSHLGARSSFQPMEWLWLSAPIRG